MPPLVDFFAERCPFEEIYPVVKVDRWHVDEFYRIRVYLKIIALQSKLRIVVTLRRSSILVEADILP